MHAMYVCKRILFYILNILLYFKLKFSNVKRIFIYLLWNNYTHILFKFILIVLLHVKCNLYTSLNIHIGVKLMLWKRRALGPGSSERGVVLNGATYST